MQEIKLIVRGIEMTLDEARALHAELGLIFGPRGTYYPVPMVAPLWPRPAWEPPFIVTCDNGTSATPPRPQTVIYS